MSTRPSIILFTYHTCIIYAVVTAGGYNKTLLREIKLKRIKYLYEIVAFGNSAMVLFDGF